MSSSGVLGQPHRITYTAKSLVSGLTDIKAYVIKPDLNRVGPFALNELADPKFAGFYFFDFITAPSDSPGEYFGIIDSPSENGHRAPFKINFSGDRAILQNIDTRTVNLPGDPASDSTVTTRTQAILDGLTDVVRISDLSAISGVLNYKAEMSAVFKNDTNKHEILTWLNRNNTRLLDTSNCTVQFRNADGGLVWQATDNIPNADGFFKVISPELALQKDSNYYVLITINDSNGVPHTTTLPTYTVG